LLSNIFSIPNIIYAHGGDVFDPSKLSKTPSGKGLLSWFLRLSLKIQVRLAKHVLCQTEDMKSRIEELSNTTSSKISVVPLPFKKLDLKLHRKIANRKIFRLITIARLVVRKNIDKIIEALSRLPNNVLLQIVGDGPEMENLKGLQRLAI
jgi:glycosyltransferase involved in cell wall biosynthesis